MVLGADIIIALSGAVCLFISFLFAFSVQFHVFRGRNNNRRKNREFI